MHKRLTRLGLLDLLTATFDGVDGHSSGVDYVVVTCRILQAVCMASCPPSIWCSMEYHRDLFYVITRVLYRAELSRAVAQRCLSTSTLITVRYDLVISNDVHSVIDRFSSCVHNVETWMGASRLRVNANKTQVSWLG